MTAWNLDNNVFEVGQYHSWLNTQPFLRLTLSPSWWSEGGLVWSSYPIWPPPVWNKSQSTISSLANTISFGLDLVTYLFQFMIQIPYWRTAVRALVKQFRQIVNVHITQIFQVQARLKGDLNNHREKKHDSNEEIHNSQSSSCPKCDQYLTWITRK